MRNWSKHIAGGLLTLLLLLYLARHWEQLGVLFRLSGGQLGGIYALLGAATLNNSWNAKQVLRVFGINTSVREMVLLRSAARLLNYVPMKVGTVVRANYMKRRYALSYSNFFTLQVYLLVVMVGVAGAIGLITLWLRYGFEDSANLAMGLLFGALLVGSAAFLWMPFTVPKSQTRLSRIFRSFLRGRQLVSSHFYVVVRCVMHHTGTFVLTGVRIGIVYQALGQSVPWSGCLILGVLGFTSLIISFTPGGLGVREIVLGLGAALLGIPFDVGILAAMLERAIMLSWTFVIGGSCAVWLWRKYPEDFTAREDKSHRYNSTL